MWQEISRAELINLLLAVLLLLVGLALIAFCVVALCKLLIAGMARLRRRRRS